MDTTAFAEPAATPTPRLTTPPPTPWRQVWPGVIFFLLLGIVFSLSELPRAWGLSGTLIPLTGILWLGLYLLILAGTLAGILFGYPRWANLYLAFSLLFGAFLAASGTSGVVFFDNRVLDLVLWKLLVCVPLPLVLFAAATARRKPPLPVLLLDSWLKDPSQLAFGLSGLLPLVCLMSLDGVDNSYAFPAVILSALILTASSLVYLRFAPRRAALMALFSAAFASLYASSIIGSVYWAQFMVDFSTGERWRVAETFEVGEVLTRSLTGPLVICALLIGLYYAGKLFARQVSTPAGA